MQIYANEILWRPESVSKYVHIYRRTSIVWLLFLMFVFIFDLETRTSSYIRNNEKGMMDSIARVEAQGNAHNILYIYMLKISRSGCKTTSQKK